jgi:hypothetical protein
MVKIDLKKTLKHLYNPSVQAVSVVDVPPMNFLLVDGEGNPNTSQAYAEAVEALYSLAYALKFKIKKECEIDYLVMPLEGLWWADDMATFISRQKDAWQWTMMIMQPEYVTAELFQTVLTTVVKKKSLPALNRIRFEAYHEGMATQMMYIGSYDAEGPTIARLHDHIVQSGYARHGKHHEIYLGDPHKTTPEKLKTVIRQPMK